jgi:hypothetical protein
MQDVNVFDNLR